MTPIDSARVQQQLIAYDKMGRDTLNVTIGPAMNSTDEQKLVVRKTYDAGGLMTRLTRISMPDPAGIDSITTRWTYDNAGRVLTEIAPDTTPGNPNDNPRDSTVYDPAGNVLEQHTRRMCGGNRCVITMEYDVLNRLTLRTSPEAHYESFTDGIASTDLFQRWQDENRPYPWYPKDDSTGYRILEDVAQFEYDERGNMTVADNADAQVRRSYYPNGQLETETQRLRTTEGQNFNQHNYLISYTYDRNGRRKDVIHPAQLRTGTPRDRVSYAYHPQMGALQAVTDLLNKVFTYGYDNAGRMTSLVLPGGISQSYEYDADNRLIEHEVTNGSQSAYKYAESFLRQATFEYDARDRLLWTRNGTGPRDTLQSFYSGLGHVRQGVVVSTGQSQGGTAATSTSLEILLHDALGNILVTHRDNSFAAPRWFTSEPTTRRHIYEPGTGRLVAIASENPSLHGADEHHYNEAGDLLFVTTVGDFPPQLRDRAAWYDAAGQVRATEARSALSAPIGK